jgi:site-specific recombinase XerC
VPAHLQDLQRSFLRHLRAEGRSRVTLRLYGQALTFFFRWLESEGRKATVDELNRAAIREWLAVLTGDHEPGSVKMRHRGLFRFCVWLVKEGELTDNPMRNLSAPALRMKPVPVITDDELAALLKACAGRDFNDRYQDCRRARHIHRGGDQPNQSGQRRRDPRHRASRPAWCDGRLSRPVPTPSVVTTG